MEKRSNKKILSKVFNILITILLIGWITVLLIDYANVSKGKSAKFCINNTIKDYTDGSVEICTGLGYKVYNYDRQGYKAIEFGPFWMEEKDPTTLK